MRSIPKLKAGGVSKSKYPEHECYRRKMQKCLEQKMSFTPQIARLLSGVLLHLRDDKTQTQRDVILDFFSVAARGQLQ